jgi:pimeloyl-ACP methyl ester carboxylesterase
MTAPLPFVLSWLFGLISLAVLGAGGWFGWEWWEDYRVYGDAAVRWPLYLSLALIAVSFLGKYLVLLFFKGDKNKPSPLKGESRMLAASDGTKLHVESYGPAGAPAVVLTHGWGLNATLWCYAQRALSQGFRVIAWDLPGTGKSSRPPDGKISLDRFAAALKTVLAEAGGPAVLVGHSIGGMTTLTFCRDFPELLGREAVGIALVDTTYTDPIQTMWGRSVFRPLKKPVIEPLMHLTIWLSPLVWLTTWLSYLNGTAHIVSRIAGFSRAVTRARLDYTTRQVCKVSPAVQCKGNLAMMHWDASEVLRMNLPVPVRILVGENDILTLPEASREMSAAIRPAELTAYQPAGHMGFFERDKDYDTAIGDFARQCFARPMAA